MHRLERVALLVAVRRQPLQEGGRLGDIAEDLLALMTEAEIAADRRQPVLAAATDAAEQGIARHGHFRRDPAHGFHVPRLAKIRFGRAKFGDVLCGNFDPVRGRSQDLQPDVETRAVLLLPHRLD